MTDEGRGAVRFTFTVDVDWKKWNAEYGEGFSLSELTEAVTNDVKEALNAHSTGALSAHRSGAPRIRS